MQLWSHIVLLLAVTLALCVVNLVSIWRTIEHELDGARHLRRPQTHEPRDRPRPRTPPPPASRDNATAGIDPEKLRAYRVLQEAGVAPITPEVVARLPRWSDVVAQYGPAPILHLESCAAYRAAVPQAERLAGVAGLFNTGTHLLGVLLYQNCQIDRPRGTGMRSQVPWGKHNPPSTHRLKNVAQVGGNVSQTAVFPVVLIKDPYHWAASQCRHRYFTNWKHDPEHCPNVVDWQSRQPVRATVLFALGKVRHATLLDVWSTWYDDYDTSRFPRAIIRFEDLLFHAEEVVTQVCACVGGRRRHGGKFQHLEESPKAGIEGHQGGGSGLVEAMIRYGDPALRLEGWTERDWEYAAAHLEGGLMDKYGYTRPRSRWGS